MSVSIDARKIMEEIIEMADAEFNDGFSKLYDKLPIECEVEYSLCPDNRLSIETISVKIENFEVLVERIVDILWDMSWMNGMLSEGDRGISEYRAIKTQKHIIPKIKDGAFSPNNSAGNAFKEKSPSPT